MASEEPKHTTFVGEGQDWKPGNYEDKTLSAWDYTPCGGFQKRVAEKSVMDTFTGFNYNKMNNRPGEYYAKQPVPFTENEWDEEAYWNKWVPTKSSEAVEAELNEPVEKLKERYNDFAEEGVTWTPALQMMTAKTPPARPLYFKLAPFFQTNTLGYRKNWANTNLCEYRPMQRIRLHRGYFFTDWFYRFLFMKFNVTFRPKLKYFKGMVGLSILCMFQDHIWAREYRMRNKFH